MSPKKDIILGLDIQEDILNLSEELQDVKSISDHVNLTSLKINKRLETYFSGLVNDNDRALEELKSETAECLEDIIVNYSVHFDTINVNVSDLIDSILHRASTLGRATLDLDEVRELIDKYRTKSNKRPLVIDLDKILDDGDISDIQNTLAAAIKDVTNDMLEKTGFLDALGIRRLDIVFSDFIKSINSSSVKNNIKRSLLGDIITVMSVMASISDSYNLDYLTTSQLEMLDLFEIDMVNSAIENAGTDRKEYLHVLGLYKTAKNRCESDFIISDLLRLQKKAWDYNMASHGNDLTLFMGTNLKGRLESKPLGAGSIHTDIPVIEIDEPESYFASGFNPLSFGDKSFFPDVVKTSEISDIGLGFRFVPNDTL